MLLACMISKAHGDGGGARNLDRLHARNQTVLKNLLLIIWRGAGTRAIDISNPSCHRFTRRRVHAVSEIHDCDL